MANIPLNSFMTLHMLLKITSAVEFLVTNVTREPTAFVVWHQQMCLELFKPHKPFWTVSTWERLCTSVNKNMILHISDCRKLLFTVWTRMRSYVAVYTSFMYLQVAGCAETFLTQRTLERFFSSVDSHVTFYFTRWSKCLVTQLTIVRFLSTVSSAVRNKVTRLRKPFSTYRTLEWFLSWMSSSVSCQHDIVCKTLSTFTALVFAAMHVHMPSQLSLSPKQFLTPITQIRLHISMSVTLSRCKLFVTHGRNMQCWLAIL